MPEPTRQSLCCSQPEHGPTLSHQMSQGKKKHMARPGLEPRTSRRPCEQSDHWATKPHSRPVTLKFFATRFSGTVRPRRLKLGTHVDSGQMYRVYRNQAAAAAYSPLYFFIFLSNFQTLKFFVTLFSGTVRPRRLKLGTHVDSGQLYRVYRNPAAPAYLSLYSFFFPIFKHRNFLSHFSQELSGLEGWNLVHTWTVGRCIMYTGIRLLLLIGPFIFHHAEKYSRRLFGCLKLVYCRVSVETYS